MAAEYNESETELSCPEAQAKSNLHCKKSCTIEFPCMQFSILDDSYSTLYCNFTENIYMRVLTAFSLLMSLQ